LRIGEIRPTRQAIGVGDWRAVRHRRTQLPGDDVTRVVIELWQNPDANLPGRYAYRKGENDRSQITPDNKTRPLNQASAVRSSFG